MPAKRSPVYQPTQPKRMRIYDDEDDLDGFIVRDEDGGNFLTFIRILTYF